jgi:hypothetical protein
MADLSITPGRTGTARAVIRVSREDSKPVAATSVLLKMQSRDNPSPTISHTAEQSADGDWHVAKVAIPTAGVWIATVVIHGGGSAPIELDAPIVILQCSNECW